MAPLSSTPAWKSWWRSLVGFPVLGVMQSQTWLVTSSPYSLPTLERACQPLPCSCWGIQEWRTWWAAVWSAESDTTESSLAAAATAWYSILYVLHTCSVNSHVNSFCLDYSHQAHSSHELLQWEYWVSPHFPFRDIPNQTCVSCIVRRFTHHWAT